jgi:phosphatidylserine/phosphatidylglycerophosphate/cardiolipin synthase-like enzyme
LYTADDGSTPVALSITNTFKVAVYFSPDAAGFDSLVAQIHSASSRVDMAMRYLGYDKVNNAVMQTASNGIPVRLAVDKDMYRKYFAPYQKVLSQTNVTTYASLPKEPGLHLKVTAIDDRWLWTGSANATVWADKLDIEDMLQIESPEVTAAYRQMFDQLANWFEQNPKNRHKNALERNANSGSPTAKPKKTGTDQNVAQP